MRSITLPALLSLTLAAMLVAACGGDDPEPAPTIAPDATPVQMTLISPAFEDGDPLPDEYVCQGQAPGISPPLSWSGAPQGTRSFVLSLTDLDGPIGPLQHWLVFDMDGDADSVGPGQETGEKVNGGTQGRNELNRRNDYTGPCLPAGFPEHHYEFHIYALNTKLGVWDRAFLGDVKIAMAGHVLAEGVLRAVYVP